MFVIIVYAILRNFSIPTAPAGDYILKSVEVKTDAGYETIEEYFDKSYFITIDDEGLLISHSSDKGIVENDVGYVVAVIGEDEIEKQVVKIKEMKSGKESEVKIEKLDSMRISLILKGGHFFGTLDE